MGFHITVSQCDVAKFYCVNFLGTNFQGYCQANRSNCNKCCREYWLTEVTNND